MNSSVAEWLDKTERGRELLGRVPMGRLGKEEELVRAVVYLASDAASFTTGRILVVDGGSWHVVQISRSVWRTANFDARPEGENEWLHDVSISKCLQ
jgi:hypothetical protein